LIGCHGLGESMSANPDNGNFSDCGAVLVAGGSGTRMGTSEEGPKQFRPLAGKALFLWSVEFFAAQPSVREVVVAVPESLIPHAEQLLAQISSQISIRCVPGGKRRQDSVLSGLVALSPECALAAVHDGARPFPPADFEAVVGKARRGHGLIYATPVTDSLKRIMDGVISDSVPRERLWAAQTPQIFRRDLLIEALGKCESHGSEVTDEAAAMEFAGYPSGIAEGSRRNIKITVPEDFAYAEILAAERRKS
jgi:2-C-methyl-D-erythritol 4-phosphate cytidylyltransferase